MGEPTDSVGTASPAGRVRDLAERVVRGGAFWFMLSNLLPLSAALILGSLNLRKVGLEEYAVLGMSGYLLGLILTYSDFGAQSHLLVAFSNGARGRLADFGNALALKAILLLLFAVGTWALALAHPRKDPLYPLLALSMIGLLLPPANAEWYFIARGRHRELFAVRATVIGVQATLTGAWFATDSRSVFVVPLIGLGGVFAGGLLLLRFLGARLLLDAARAARSASFAGLRGLVPRLFPIAAGQLLTPYFLAHALPWYTLAMPDRDLVGVFAVPYRIILGFLALTGPLVSFALPYVAAGRAGVPLGRMAILSLAATAGMWTVAAPVLWGYLRFAGVDAAHFPFALEVLSTLLVGIFFICLRTLLVGRAMVEGRYWFYFLVHLASCGPVFVLARISGGSIPAGWVPLLACLPDAFATLGFLADHLLRRDRAGAAPISTLNRTDL